MNTKKPTIVIYKAIFGDYDKKPKPVPIILNKDIRFVLITDINIEVSGWELLLVNKDNPVFNNRHCKMFPWKYFDADISLYLDGHIEFGKKFHEYLDQMILNNHNFAVNRHRSKGKISDELIRCIDNSKLGKNQIASILNSDLILDAPSVECGMIFRNHDNSNVREHANKWWWYFNNLCPRDQLSVHTAARDSNIEISILDSDFSNKDYFEIVGHKNWLLTVIKARFKNASRVFLKGTLLGD